MVYRWTHPELGEFVHDEVAGIGYSHEPQPFN